MRYRRRMLRLACVFTLVLACTKTSETTHPAAMIVPADAASVSVPLAPADAASVAVADASVPLDATAIPVTRSAVLASCPKTYPIAVAGTCSLASVDKLACAYPDGHCSCVLFRPCAGWAGAYEQARKHPTAQWDCTPKVRSDGCLGDMPAIGSTCEQDGKECAYAKCGGDVLVCRSNVWAIARQISPPP